MSHSNHISICYCDECDYNRHLAELPERNKPYKESTPVKPGPGELGDTRVFQTGATRGMDSDKLDYEGFISPQVWRKFAEYMHECRLRNIPPGQTVRSSDNWQKGLPITEYMKSLTRHHMELWELHRSHPVFIGNRQAKIKALCAIMFNVQGMIFELLNATD